MQANKGPNGKRCRQKKPTQWTPSVARECDQKAPAPVRREPQSLEPRGLAVYSVHVQWEKLRCLGAMTHSHVTSLQTSTSHQISKGAMEDPDLATHPDPGGDMSP